MPESKSALLLTVQQDGHPGGIRIFMGLGDGKAIQQSGGDDTERKNVAQQCDANLSNAALDAAIAGRKGAEKGAEGATQATPEQRVTAAGDSVGKVANFLSETDGNGHTFADRACKAGEGAHIQSLRDTFADLQNTLKQMGPSASFNLEGGALDPKKLTALMTSLDKSIKS
jgi:hypothetical protein